ncbi:MAG: diguanylate cyclase [Candidatus Firestonebacteria bacterium]|nr:diguanylate cyclase [Candidatus Firestonebacteria bacterium]
MSDYEKSIYAYEQYNKISLKIKDISGIGASYHNMADCYTEKGDFKKAKEFAEKGLKLSLNSKNQFPICTAYIHIGYCELEQDNYDQAIKYLEEAKNINEKNTFLKNFTVFLYPYLADSYINRFLLIMKEFNVNQKYTELTRTKNICNLSLKKTIKWPLHHSCSLRVTGKYYTLLNKNKKADKYFIKSIEYSKKIGRKYELAKCLYEYSIFLKSIKRDNDSFNNLLSAYNIFNEINAKKYIQLCNVLSKTIKIKDMNMEENSNKSNETISKERDLSIILNITREISSILDLNELLNRIIDRTMELVGAERGVIFLYSDEISEKKSLEIKVTKNIDNKDIETQSKLLSYSIIEEVEKNKKPIIIENALSDNKFNIHSSVVLNGLKSIICAPIIIRGEILGLIYLDNRFYTGLFRQRDIEILDMICSQSGISIQNAILYKKAIHDALTTTYNRNFFDNYLTKVVSEAKRYNTEVCLIILDIDNFKRFNDNYGHETGDELLKTISNKIVNNIRECDIAARYDEDKFAIILPNTDINGASLIGKKIKDIIAETEIISKGQINEEKLSVTISMGIAELEKYDRIKLIEDALKALNKRDI